MTAAIVLAAGKGSRMHTDVAKQYLKIGDKEVLYYSLKAFQDCENIDNIILVAGAGDIEFCEKNIITRYGLSKVKKICAGGAERYHSVYQGLLAVNELGIDKNGIVIIHDGARPFVTKEMIDSSIEGAKLHGACTVGIPVKDTIKIVDKNNFGVETPDRNFLYQIQTPQTFKVQLLMDAYERMFADEKHNITDDTMLVEQYIGVRSKVVFGSYENIKITTPEDLEIAEKFLEKNFKKCVDK